MFLEEKKENTKPELANGNAALSMCFPRREYLMSNHYWFKGHLGEIFQERNGVLFFHANVIVVNVIHNIFLCSKNMTFVTVEYCIIYAQKMCQLNLCTSVVTHF